MAARCQQFCEEKCLLHEACTGALLACRDPFWALRSSSEQLSVTLAFAAQDEDNLREALRYSAAMLVELRTSLLTPQKYFELYMQAFDELRHLEVLLFQTSVSVHLWSNHMIFHSTMLMESDVGILQGGTL